MFMTVYSNPATKYFHLYHQYRFDPHPSHPFIYTINTVSTPLSPFRLSISPTSPHIYKAHPTPCTQRIPPPPPIMGLLTLANIPNLQNPSMNLVLLYRVGVGGYTVLCTLENVSMISY